jgi:threonine synthase
MTDPGASETSVRYVSTRGAAPVLSFPDALLAGLARDGGLYVPETVPVLSADAFRSLRGRSYVEVARAIMAPFVAGTIDSGAFDGMVADAYAGFDHRAVTPLRQLDGDLWLLELFHGPTLAFKDVAMQMLGRLFDFELHRRGERVTIVGATSGDTGAAAIEAFRDRDAVDIVILHPKGRVSDVQRRQMTTVPAGNVHNVAIEGTFDDCQDLVKAMFNDVGFRDEMNLSAVNSINWARVMAQIVYYVYAAVQLGAPDREIAFAVPSGNFGNVYAGVMARRMGLPIRRFGVGSNSNDILTRFFRDDDMSVRPVVPTLSPSMDIQVSSNFERLLYDLYEGSGADVAESMQTFRQTGRLGVGGNRWRGAADLFQACSLSDEETVAVIAREYAGTGELLDPHAAIGVAAAQALPRDVPVVALATAHPAKFPDAVERATGIRPPLPPRLADLASRPERVTVLRNDVRQVQDFVRAHRRS